MESVSRPLPGRAVTPKRARPGSRPGTQVPWWQVRIGTEGLYTAVVVVVAPGVVNVRGSVQGEYPALLRARTWNTKLSPP